MRAQARGLLGRATLGVAVVAASFAPAAPASGDAAAGNVLYAKY